MISLSLLLLLNVLLSQLSQAVIKQDYETIRNHSATIAQILLIQDKQKIYLRMYGQYLVMLRWCESRWIDNALNAADLNGKPSKGRYQFQDKSFLHYTTKYDLYGKIYDGELQEKLVVKMLKDPEVNLKVEFPDCNKKWGWLLRNDLTKN